MATSKAAVARYKKRVYSCVSLRYRKEFVAVLNDAVAASGQSKAAYIRQAIEERMARDGLVEFLQKVEAYKEDEEDE